MQVILQQDVDFLGFAGDVVDVKRGYWRNFLQPRSLAELATSDRVAELAERMERRRASQARNEDEAKELQSLLNRTVLTIEAHAGEQGKLFGSVGANEIAKALDKARKLRVDAKKISLDTPIKELGTHMVTIDVFSGVKAEVKTIVVASATPLPEEPKAQAAPDEPAEPKAQATSDAEPAVAAAE